MTLNPYAPLRFVADGDVLPSLTQRIRGFTHRRVSLVYIASSIIGIYAGVSYRAGITTALSDLFTANALIALVFFSAISFIPCVIYRPPLSHRHLFFIRCLGGLTFGVFATLAEPIVNRFARSHPELNLSNWAYFSLLILVSGIVSIGAQCVLADRLPSVGAPHTTGSHG